MSYVHGILPPYLLDALSKQTTQSQLQEMAKKTLITTERMRGARAQIGRMAFSLATPAGTKRRTVYDAEHKFNLPGVLKRSEADANPATDPTVNRAFDGTGATYDLFDKIFNRNSIDGHGFRLDSSVHYDIGYCNAFWDGKQMVFGDGDGFIFNCFTSCVDIIGHELTHGVVQYEADLIYQDQSGALNEHFADVFGILVKQYLLQQKAEESDWLIGAGLFTKNVQKGDGLRSMSAPGTAYEDPYLGKDPQPADMDHYDPTPEDDGGVHINSGIPNRAFYQTAITLGGYAWERAGKIWYDVLCNRLKSDADFQKMADATSASAGALFGPGSEEQRAVEQAWGVVKVKLPV